VARSVRDADALHQIVEPRIAVPTVEPRADLECETWLACFERAALSPESVTSPINILFLTARITHDSFRWSAHSQLKRLFATTEA